MDGTPKVLGALSLAVAAVSCAAVLILVADPLPPAWIAEGRVAVTGTALLVLGRREMGAARRALYRGGAQLVGRLLLASVLLALHFGVWVTSLSETSVLRSTALVATQPLFAGLLGRFVGDTASWRLYLGAMVAVIGSVALVAGSGPGQAAAGSMRTGDALALVGAVAAAGYLLVGRSVRDHLPLSPYLGVVHLLAATVLLPFAALTDTTAMRGVETVDWLAVLAMGLVPGVVGHGLLNWAVRRVPVHVVALAILLEPLGATMLAVALLGRHVTAFECLGALILLAGVAVGLPRRRITSRGGRSPAEADIATDGPPPPPLEPR